MNTVLFGDALMSGRDAAVIAARGTGSRDPEDAASEAVLRLFIAGAPDDGSVRHVICQLVQATRHVVIDAHRRDAAFDGRRRALTLDFDESQHPCYWPHEERERVEESAHLAARVLEQVAQLEPLSRAIVLETVAGCSPAEIAARHGIEPGTARTRLFRARQALRAAVGR